MEANYKINPELGAAVTGAFETDEIREALKSRGHTLEEYFNYLRRKGNYADSDIIFATALVLGIQVAVKKEGQRFMVYKPDEVSPNALVIHFSHPRNHFDVLEPVEAHKEHKSESLPSETDPDTAKNTFQERASAIASIYQEEGLRPIGVKEQPPGVFARLGSFKIFRVKELAPRPKSGDDNVVIPIIRSQITIQDVAANLDQVLANMGIAPVTDESAY